MATDQGYRSCTNGDEGLTTGPTQKIWDIYSEIWMKNEKIGSNTYTFRIELIFHRASRFFFKITKRLKFSVHQ